ncbi:arsenate reductase family protein [Streptococcus phocae subsp. phocae]|uniref:Arsenate reductase n=1 Tax=Streptococcus phocae TaxID=119224 RepID=A0A0P6SK98_9STRE|nr:arsenate reductase family protein [Streptococcus phocae]KPJ21911.1 arsenate reductase [Streptococcus phocae]
MFTLYHYPKCTTCKKAIADLKHHTDQFEVIDIKENPPKAEQLKAWMAQSDGRLKQFFNTSGQRYRELGLKDKVDTMDATQAAELLATDGMLIKRPILIKDGQLVQIGYRTPYENLD